MPDNLTMLLLSYLANFTMSLLTAACCCDTYSSLQTCIEHVHKLFDCTVTLLPRVDQFWYKYIYLEELLQNIAGALQEFE